MSSDKNIKHKVEDGDNMQVVVCIDDNNGMMFNHRRLSKDRVVIDRIVESTKEKRLFINTYSCELFEKVKNVVACTDFLYQAGENDICFVESDSLLEFESKIDKLTVYRWNRSYPADFYFDLPLDKWKLVKCSDLAGNSHDRITEEIYTR